MDNARVWRQGTIVPPWAVGLPVYVDKIAVRLHDRAELKTRRWHYLTGTIHIDKKLRNV